MNNRIKHSCIILFLVISMLSCIKEKNNVLIHNYDDIIEYLNMNRDDICGKNYYKGITSLYLTDEQKEFYNNRLTYLINILKGDEINKKMYSNEHYNYMILFKGESIDYFYRSISIFDYMLFDLIEKNFENKYIPIKYCKEYFMDYRLMINQKNL